MKTLFSIAMLLGFWIAGQFFAVIIVNLAGLPGAVLAGTPGVRSKARFVTGSLISALGQSYVYLSFVAFVVNWTRLAAQRADVSGFFIWPFAFLACFGPIATCLQRGREEAKELAHAHPQVEALNITVLLAFLGFFLFAFAPVTTAPWSWVPYWDVTHR